VSRSPHSPAPDPARVETVHLVLELNHLLGANLAVVAAEFGLTPVQARALITLEEPAPMRDLASRLSCDKSNVTGIVDGLEERGLVARQADPNDRRVKQLGFTGSGRELRRLMQVRLYTDVPGISNLTADEETQLRALLRRALHSEPPA